MSYNHQDAEAVQGVCRYLKERGVCIWIDKEQLRPGDAWQERLEAALRECHTCLVFWGPQGLRRWQNEEARVIMNKRVSSPRYRVIPLLLPGCLDPARMSPFLRRYQWVDLRSDLDTPAELERLIALLRTQNGGRSHPPARAGSRRAGGPGS